MQCTYTTYFLLKPLNCARSRQATRSHCVSMPLAHQPPRGRNSAFKYVNTIEWHPFWSPFLDLMHGTLWARIAQNVKKPPLTVNVINFEFFGFNVSIWVPWSPLGPKKSWYIVRIIQIHKICGEKQGAFWFISKISLKSLNSVSWLFWRLAL